MKGIKRTAQKATQTNGFHFLLLEVDMSFIYYSVPWTNNTNLGFLLLYFTL